MAFYDEIKTSSGAYKYYVNGQWLESKSGKTQAIINPSTNQPVYQVQGESAIRVPARTFEAPSGSLGAAAAGLAYIIPRDHAPIRRYCMPGGLASCLRC